MARIRLLLAAVLSNALLAPWLPGVARAEAAAAPDPLAAAMAAYPGGAWVLIEQDGTVRSGAWGHGAAGTPFTPETPVALYSATKPMTAALAVRLEAQGRVDLDRPIGDYVQVPPELAGRKAAGLLRGSAGIRHYRPGEWPLISTRSCRSPEELLDLFVNDPLGPDGRFVYSSYSYVLASHLLSRAAGAPFADLLREEVLEPAGVTARLWEPGLRRPPNGFELVDGQIVPGHAVDNSCKQGAGGLVGTAGDLARFGHAVLGDLLTDDMRERMLALDPASGGAYAMGWTVLKGSDDKRIALHSGNGLGATTVVAIDLGTGRALGLVGNLQGPDLTALAMNLLRMESSPPHLDGEGDGS